MAWPYFLNGATVTFTAGGSGAFIAEIDSASWSGITRTAIDLSSGSTVGAKSFGFSPKYDPGELTITMSFDATHNARDIEAAIVSAAEPVTFNFAGGTDKWRATGGLTSYEWSGDDEGKMVATATIKFSGEIETNPA